MQLAERDSGDWGGWLATFLRSCSAGLPLLVIGLLAACGSDSGGEQTQSSDVQSMASDLAGTVVVAGLDGPTQLALAPDGTWYVAQLAGGENDGTGQVLRFDPDALAAEPAVVLDGLDKPTGVAVFGGDLWVMERDRLLRSNLDGGGLRVVLDNLVSNGRSEGSLSVDGDRLLFDTSGTLSAMTATPVDPASSSGVLWSVDENEEVAPVAWGFKHAYAQARTADGTLWTTELADGRYDGVAAVDELVAVTEAADHGWPRCVGDNRAVAEHGGDEAGCADVPGSQAVFPSGSTPTGLAVSPWDPEVLLVALWLAGEVVAVSTADQLTLPVAPVVVYSAAGQPQGLTVDGDRVLLVDHARGEVVALTEPES